jgi:inosose dehydratase
MLTMNGKLRLAICPIGWTNDDLPELGGEIPFEQCVSEMALAGYKGTEVGTKYPKDTKMLKAALALRGLEVSSRWCSTWFTEEGKEGESIDNFKQMARYLKTMGSRFINVCECGNCIQGMPVPILADHKPVLNDQQWHQLAKGLNRIGQMAGKMGLTLVYHYHMGTCVQNRVEIDRLMEITDPEKVSLLLDTGHIYFAGGDPLQLARDYANRIKYVHAKDIRPRVLRQVREDNLSFLDAVKAGVFTVPGDGIIDFKPILSHLRKAGYAGWVAVEAEQDPAKANPLEYAQKGYDYIVNTAGVRQFA